MLSEGIEVKAEKNQSTELEMLASKEQENHLAGE